MDKPELGNLVTDVARRIRQDGAVIDLGREYGLTLIDLFFYDGSGDYAHDFLFFARHDGDPIYQGEKADVSIETAADEAQALLERKEKWRTLALENNLRTIYIAVRRDVGAVKRYLYSGDLAPADAPGDPLIVF